jgi:pimeloyl-ACP methyl ester carboxylesterase
MPVNSTDRRGSWVTSIQANGIRIEYETIGQPAGQPLVLIMGFGAQLIHWPEDFLASLAERGLFVIVFDNRDTGLSEHLDGIPPTNAEQLRAVQRGDATAPYLHEDMADDTGGLIAALGVGSAHVLGVSMGTTIAGKLALRYPAKVRSLVLMMTPTYAPGLPGPTPEAAAILSRATTPLTDRDAYIDQQVVAWKGLSGDPARYDAAAVASVAALAFDRAFYPEGIVRQAAAGAVTRAAGPATEELAHLQTPTLVLHGNNDPVVSVEHGVLAARTLPNAELRIIDGWGHEPPPPHLQASIADAVVARVGKTIDAVA